MGSMHFESFITKICILLYGLNIFNFNPLNFIKNLMNNN